MVHRDIVIRLHGKTATLTFTDSALTVSRGAATDTSSARSAKSSDSATKSKSDVEVPLRNVLGAEFDEKTREIVIHFVSRKKKNGKGPHVLVKITGAVKDAENYTAKLWVDNLVYADPYKQFMANCLAEWKSSTKAAFLMFAYVLVFHDGIRSRRTEFGVLVSTSSS